MFFTEDPLSEYIHVPARYIAPIPANSILKDNTNPDRMSVNLCAANCTLLFRSGNFPCYAFEYTPGSNMCIYTNITTLVLNAGYLSIPKGYILSIFILDYSNIGIFIPKYSIIQIFILDYPNIQIFIRDYSIILIFLPDYSKIRIFIPDYSDVYSDYPNIQIFISDYSNIQIFIPITRIFRYISRLLEYSDIYSDY